MMMHITAALNLAIFAAIAILALGGAEHPPVTEPTKIVEIAR